MCFVKRDHEKLQLTRIARLYAGQNAIRERVLPTPRGKFWNKLIQLIEAGLHGRTFLEETFSEFINIVFQIHLVRRPKIAEFLPKYVNHAGRKINVRECFSWNGVGPLYRIEGIFYKEECVEIMRDVLLPQVEEKMLVIWTFWQDTDSKYTTRLTRQLQLIFINYNYYYLIWYNY